MTLRRIFFRIIVRTLEFITQIQPPLKSTLSTDKLPDGAFDLITVAFNNFTLIEYQDKFLKCFIKDNYNRIIIDNSTDLAIAQKIERFCVDNSISYVKVPKNYLNLIGVSYSHANAVNYYHKHFCLKRAPQYFGILDHDIFPISPLRLRDYLTSQKAFGPLRERGDKAWYLSAVITLLDFSDQVFNKHFDFLPAQVDGHYLDTGGCNWYGIYSKLDKNSMRFPTEEFDTLRDGGDYHGDTIELYDNKKWIHTINGSCWKAVKPGKELCIIQKLDSYLPSSEKKPVNV